ncbi:Hypothetical predicted protein [Xyrichtys novacula]|uniref:Uncharacterized protein n=1 Tax=Xyrichtys novacula TaxID=13765 RepID=A0AAV1HTH5_XYRNO|nr:Hypothetical predicted protein [Xyrichtys novacula]
MNADGGRTARKQNATAERTSDQNGGRRLNFDLDFETRRLVPVGRPDLSRGGAPPPPPSSPLLYHLLLSLSPPLLSFPLSSSPSSSLSFTSCCSSEGGGVPCRTPPVSRTRGCLRITNNGRADGGAAAALEMVQSSEMLTSIVGLAEERRGKEGWRKLNTHLMGGKLAPFAVSAPFHLAK